MTPRLGTDGSRIVYPVRGIVQGARDIGRHPQRRTIAYVATLILAALVVAASLVGAGYTLESPFTVLALSVAAAVAERISVRFAVAKRGLTSTEEQSIHLLPTLFAAVLFGPLAAGVVGAASMLGDPELIAQARPRSGTATQVGDIHEYPVHWRRCNGVRGTGDVGSGPV